MNFPRLEVGPWSEWAAAIASVASVWIASTLAKNAALKGARVQIDAATAAQEREKAELRRRVAGALLGEIGGIETRAANIKMVATYRQLAAQFANSPTPPMFWPTFKAHQSYTAVYDSLAEKLGSFEADLAREIASYYIEMKGIIDTINVAAEMNLAAFPAPVIADGATKLADDIETLLTNGTALKKRLRAIAELL